MVDDMPPQPKTIELPKVVPPSSPTPSVAPETLAAPTVEDKIDRIEASVADLSSKMNYFVDELQTTNKRLSEAESWRMRFESRISSHSYRAAAIVDKSSQADLEIEAKLAQEIAARLAVAEDLKKARAEIQETRTEIRETNAAQDKKIDVLLAIGTRLDKVAERPLVKMLAAMTVFTILQVVAAHYGVKIPLPQISAP